MASMAACLIDMPLMLSMLVRSVMKPILISFSAACAPVAKKITASTVTKNMHGTLRFILTPLLFHVYLLCSILDRLAGNLVLYTHSFVSFPFPSYYFSVDLWRPATPVDALFA